MFQICVNCPFYYLRSVGIKMESSQVECHKWYYYDSREWRGDVVDRSLKVKVSLIGPK